MPIAIVLSQVGNIPAVLSHDNDAELLAAINALQEAPQLADRPAAEEWLAGLPAPSGWYPNADAAKARVAAMAQPLDVTPDQIKEARKSLGLSQAEFATAIGLGGNDQTRKSTVFDMEKGKRRMNPQLIGKMTALLAKAGLDTQP